MGQGRENCFGIRDFGKRIIYFGEDQSKLDARSNLMKGQQNGNMIGES